jgi:hypothetical protein
MKTDMPPDADTGLDRLRTLGRYPLGDVKEAVRVWVDTRVLGENATAMRAAFEQAAKRTSTESLIARLYVQRSALPDAPAVHQQEQGKPDAEA